MSEHIIHHCVAELSHRLLKLCFFVVIFGNISSAKLWLVVFKNYYYVSIVHRLSPKNSHQRPTVVLLCGPHIQGAQGISCGRHLANHEVEVLLFLPSFVKMEDSVTSEARLYSRTSGLQVANVRGKTHQCFTLSYCDGRFHTEPQRLYQLAVTLSHWR